MYQSSPSPAPRRSGHVYPSPFALLLLSLSPSIYISFSIHLPSILPARQPFPPPKLCPVLRGKLLRGASLFWLPYFTHSDRPPCLPRFLPFYPFSSSLSPRPPFHKLPRPSLSSWPAYRGPLSLYSRYILGPSCFIPSCVTLSLIQHVVPASETPPRSSSSPISRYPRRAVLFTFACANSRANFDLRITREGQKLRVCMWPSFIDRLISTSSWGNATAVVVMEQRLVRAIYPSTERRLGMSVRLRLPR